MTLAWSAHDDAQRALARHYALDVDALERVPVQTSWRGAATLLATGPTLVQTPDGWLALLSGTRKRARVLLPTGGIQTIGIPTIRALAAQPIVEALGREVDADLDLIGVHPRRRTAARELLLDERLGRRPAIVAQILRGAPAQSVTRHLHESGVRAALRGVVGALIPQYLLGALAWVLLGLGALAGHVDGGWLVAWALALATQLPLRGLLLAASGQVALRGGALVKRLLLAGALRGDLDAARARGLGGLVGRAIESEAFEALALNGGTRVVVGAWELVVALVIASQGTAGVGIVVAGLVALLVTVVAARRDVRARAAWTDARLAMTGTLVEQMIGHRTRLAQQAPERWHTHEDRALSEYLALSAAPDRIESSLEVWPKRAFMVVALALVAWQARSADPLVLGVALAGILLASHALETAAGGVAALASAWVAKGVVADLMTSARLPERVGVGLDAAASATRPVLELARVGFRYPGRDRAVLADVDLSLAHGERVLIEGGSGSGKSTLAAIIAGLRRPSEGLVLLRGLDFATWGEHAWRRRAVAAPQFHDNRVIAGTFAFNLLLGRGGLPDPVALAEAETLCGELGLGPLLERMPAGLFQQVGESGWQLSHGEKSRLYLARALLQGADVVLLDESFGALDPENQGRALATVMRRAPTLVVIAHPS